jgi:hypothetical protein
VFLEGKVKRGGQQHTMEKKLKIEPECSAMFRSTTLWSALSLGELTPGIPGCGCRFRTLQPSSSIGCLTTRLFDGMLGQACMI